VLPLWNHFHKAPSVILNVSAGPNTSACMGIHHHLERIQLWLPIPEDGFGLNASCVVATSNTVRNQRSILVHAACSGHLSKLLTAVKNVIFAIIEHLSETAASVGLHQLYYANTAPASPR
jgi:hypothetical protein